MQISPPPEVSTSGPVLGVVPTPSELRLQARWISTAELESLAESWEILSQSALWRNPSFEPNSLIPALAHLNNGNVRVLVIENAAAGNGPQLVGLVPVETKRLYRLPFKAAEIWKHDQCFDATPLLHKHLAVQAWSMICRQLDDEGYKLLSLDTVSAESAMEDVFRETEHLLNQHRFQRDQYQRAAFRPAETADAYVQQFVSKSTRKNFRRMLRRLEAEGVVTWEASNRTSDFQKLADAFLRIESSGWKGRAGTALASHAATRDYYLELIERSAALGKARFLSLNLDGHPIAMLSDLQSGDIVYSYKTAYDEAFASFSPGQLVEVKNIEYLQRDGIRLGDSCTATDNSTINRIWGQKLQFQNVIFSLRPGLARTALGALPFIQSAVHRLRPAQPKRTQ